MNVPNNEKKAFRDMTPEERSAIVEAWIVGDPLCGGDVQVLTDDGWATVILTDYIPLDSIYRTRPRQLVIPWEVIRDDIAWFFISSKGRNWGVTQSCYDTKPEINGDDWICDGGSKWFSLDALNIDTTGIDWRESLTARPE